MIYGLYLSTAGARAQSLRQDVIANNIANVDTTGFRRQFAIARERLDQQSENGKAPPVEGNDPRNMGGGVNLAKTCNDVSTLGPVKPTDSQFHMAISGPGFFRIEQDRKTYLTRNGAFSMASDGTLLTDDGRGKLLGIDGGPVKIDPTLPFDVTGENKVMQEGRHVGTIAVVNPRQLDSLEPHGESLFTYNGFDKPSDSKIMQRFLEGSNVEPVNEMTDLIETARAFELNIQMVQLQNDTLSQLVGQVPSPNP
ncbi:flagellar hook-basal body protein [bacterium]|nr:flagellar hook-basal body protein [bacterium]